MIVVFKENKQMDILLVSMQGGLGGSRGLPEVSLVRGLAKVGIDLSRQVNGVNYE